MGLSRERETIVCSPTCHTQGVPQEVEGQGTMGGGRGSSGGWGQRAVGGFKRRAVVEVRGQWLVENLQAAHGHPHVS